MMGICNSVSFKLLRVALISSIPSWDTVLFWLWCHVWLGRGGSFRDPHLAFCTEVFLLHRQTSRWVCTNCQIRESRYTFGDRRNDHWVVIVVNDHMPNGPTLSLSFINWSLYCPTLAESWWCFWSLDINVDSDPVSNSPWNVWVFPFPQCTITQVNDKRYFWDGLGKSLPFIFEM